jgi:glycerate dehydrogenase
MTRVVFLDAGTLPQGLSFGADSGVQYTPHETTAPSEVAGCIADADIVITNKVRLGASEMRAAPKLRLIAVAAAGTDNVDLASADELGIAVQNVPDYGSDSVAEHAIATLFALRRALPVYAAAACDGRWSASAHFCWNGPRIRDVAGSRFGIVGRGRIGEAVARIARGVGMRVTFAQTLGSPCQDDELPLDALLEQADALTLHVPLTPQTRGLIDSRALRRMKRDAILINTGRGALVDPSALADALREGVIAGAAIDVLDVEPPPADHPLLALGIPNLLLTPHVAWASDAAQAKLAGRLVELVKSHAARK